MLRKLTYMMGAALAASVALAQGTTYHVATNGPGGAATNWATAKSNIQDAISLCVSGDVVLVSNGVYQTGGVTNCPPGFILTNRVAITTMWVTVMSANNDPTNTIIKGRYDTGEPDAPDTVTNGPSAVRCVYMTNNCWLIGFTLTNGATMVTDMANSDGNGRGGGVLGASQTGSLVSNCIIVRNSAIAGGGAHSCLLVDCILSNNVASGGSGNYRGGGGACSCSMNRCDLTRNWGAAQGGGIYNGSYLYNCTISYNSAGGNGGGGVRGVTTLSNCHVIANYGGQVGGVSAGILYDCVVMCNTGGAGYYGGGMNGGTLYHSQVISNRCYNRGGGVYESTLYNCLVAWNTGAGVGGGGAWGGLMVNCTIYSNTTSGTGGGVNGGVQTNCISWANNKPDISNLCYYSCGEGYTNGGSIFGNTSGNPMFTDTNATNFQLRGQSPCVNTGTTFSWMTDPADRRNKDLDGQKRVQYGIVDMGAYEFYRPEGTIVMFR